MGAIKKERSMWYVFLIPFVLIAFVSAFYSSFAVASDNGSIDEAGLLPYVDPRILEAFNNATEVSIIVNVRDTSGVTISSNDSIEQQNIKDLQRKDFLGSKVDSVLSKLPADGFKLKGKFITGHGFYGSITKAAFDKLINDSNVGQIYYDGKGYVGGWKVASEEELKSDEAVTSANTSKYDPEILDAFNNQTWVRVIVRLIDDSNIVIVGTKEERRELMRQKDEWFKSKTESFLSRLPEDEFNVLSNNSDGFVGMITKEAFDILINDTQVSEIHLDTVGSVASTDIPIKNESVLTDAEFKKGGVTEKVSSEIEKKKINSALLLSMVGIIVIIPVIYSLIKHKKIK